MKIQRSDNHVEMSAIYSDVKQIRQDLREQILSPGAYCQEYDNFKIIYRFVERGLRRSGRQANILLLTLTDEKGSFLPLESRAPQLEILRQIIQASLRVGDVFTQYSSCQYLLMVLDASMRSTELVGKRICSKFLEEDATGICLQQEICPLTPSDQTAEAEE
ncbi:MAG: hypothetical protein RR785_01980 [Clostridium sp.]